MRGSNEAIKLMAAAAVMVTNHLRKPVRFRLSLANSF
jgi:hypothetical protein